MPIDAQPIQELEPNDSRLTAGFLGLSEDPAGSGYAMGFGLGRQDPAPYQSNFSEPDYWRVELLAGDVVSVSVATPVGGLDPYVALLDGAGNWLTNDSDAGA